MVFIMEGTMKRIPPPKTSFHRERDFLSGEVVTHMLARVWVKAEHFKYENTSGVAIRLQVPYSVLKDQSDAKLRKFIGAWIVECVRRQQAEHEKEVESMAKKSKKGGGKKGC